jgi:glycerate 2-kinase
MVTSPQARGHRSFLRLGGCHFPAPVLPCRLVRVLVIPDKFKGTLPAWAAAEAIANGWHKGRPEDQVELLPLADGGDGFGEVMGKLLSCRPRRLRTVNAAHRPCRAKWWWHPRSQTGLLESAGVIGLALLPPGRFHPFELDTLGLGKALLALRGVDSCILGIGGSATNDGGFGLARALGWQFLDRNGQPILHWTGLRALQRLQPPPRRKPFHQLLVAVDVQNPLLGVRGATRIYGPQKGLGPGEWARAEACLARLARVVSKQLGHEWARQPGAGAAGGLGFGLLAFAGAKLVDGFGLFARQARLHPRLAKAELVLTGEGALDHSTFMGKGVGRVAELCRKRKVPCLAFTGQVRGRPSVQPRFTRVYALSELTSLTRARSEPARWLERLANTAAREWNC